jgi:pimeloyl-ACP methyl ester carboxylesterase
VKTGGRKIRTEKLVLKIRNYPQGTIWIAKSDKAVIKIELPGDGLRITRVFSFRQPRASQYQYAKNGYRTEKVSFKSRGAELEGTLSVPNGSGRHPAVILVWGSGTQDRSYMGLFDSMSDYLAGKGLCVLRFDKRGIGGSSGSYLYYSTEEETLDIKAAAEYLASRDTTDPSRIAVAAHTTGADPAIRACLASDRIRLLVLLCPEIYLGQEDLLENLKRSPAAAINSRYQALIEQSFRETAARAASAKGNWAYILGKRCYLGEMKWRLSKSAPLNDSIRNIDIPVLIIQGRKDESSYPRHASLIDNALQDTGNDARVLVYYGYLGRFLGKEVSDCTHRAFYDADKDMMDGITRWINESQPKAAQK